MPTTSDERITRARIARALSEGPVATPFVELPTGTFLMGSNERPDELPVRRVSVEAFAVALVPVTNADYAHFLEATGHEPPGFWDDPRFTERSSPVVGVSWFDAVAYCEWLSGLLGRACRLPTEAEREYATRGGVPDVLYPWGDEPWSEGVHVFGAAGGDRPHPVGTSAPNGYGIYHLADNVHEWCQEWYGPYDAPPTEGVRRASRGGSWRHRIKVSRIAARSALAPDRRYNDYGMRVYAGPA